MPVILTTQEEIDHWMAAQAEEALKLQQKDEEGLAADVHACAGEGDAFLGRSKRRD